MAMVAYMMRHGETVANTQQILLGREDSPFTEAGSSQPGRVAQHLRSRSLACVYCSPMARARRTADLVLEVLGEALPLEIDAALAEIDAGEFTGYTFEQVRARVPPDAVVGAFRYPGGESWRDVQRRAVEFVFGLESRHAGDAVLLVTHAGVIAALVAEYLGEPIERYIRSRFGHDFLGQLTVEAGRFTSYEKITGTVDLWF
jgi:broad specificity phosphatase PhoE